VDKCVLQRSYFCSTVLHFCIELDMLLCRMRV
jgi:hypothetical protein